MRSHNAPGMELYIAAGSGHISRLEAAITANGHVDYTIADGETPLHAAARNGHLEAVKCLLRSYADTNIQDKDGCTPLHFASGNGHVDVALALLGAGAKRNTKNKASWTALHLAAHHGRLNVVDALLHARANKDMHTKDGETPAALATRKRHAKVVKLLISWTDDGDHKTRGEVYSASGSPMPRASPSVLGPVGGSGTPSGRIRAQFTSAAAPSPGGGSAAPARGKRRLEGPGEDQLSESKSGHQGAGREATLERPRQQNRHARQREPAVTAHRPSRQQHAALMAMKHARSQNHRPTPPMVGLPGISPYQAPFPAATAAHHAAATAVATAADEPQGASQEDVAMGLVDEASDPPSVRQDVHSVEGEHTNGLQENTTPEVSVSVHGESAGSSAPGGGLGRPQAGSSGVSREGESPVIHEVRQVSPGDLYNAASSGDLDGVRQLLATASVPADGDPNSVHGWRPLHIAALKGHAEVVAVLLRAGARGDLCSHDGCTALHLAAEEGHRVLELLLRDGICVRVDARESGGQTPLHLAAAGAHVEVIELLVAQGSQTDVRTNEGQLALHLAATSRAPQAVQAVQALLRLGADVGGLDGAGGTALHSASDAGNSQAVAVLTKRGADVNARRLDGNTPLHVAVLAQQPQVVEMLLAWGASPTLASEGGVTPLTLAERQGDDGIIRMLRAAAEPSQQPALQVSVKRQPSPQGPSPQPASSHDSNSQQQLAQHPNAQRAAGEAADSAVSPSYMATQLEVEAEGKRMSEALGDTLISDMQEMMSLLMQVEAEKGALGKAMQILRGVPVDTVGAVVPWTYNVLLQVERTVRAALRVQRKSHRRLRVLRDDMDLQSVQQLAKYCKGNEVPQLKAQEKEAQRLLLSLTHELAGLDEELAAVTEAQAGMPQLTPPPRATPSPGTFTPGSGYTPRTALVKSETFSPLSQMPELSAAKSKPGGDAEIGQPVTNAGAEAEVANQGTEPGGAQAEDEGSAGVPGQESSAGDKQQVVPAVEESSEEVQEYVAQLAGRLHSMRQSVGERPPEARGLVGLPAAAGAGLPRCAMEAIAAANMVHWKQSPALARQFVQQLREELRLLQDTVEGNRAMREPLEAQMSQARREVAQMRVWTKAGDTEGQRHLQEEEARVERMQGEVRSFQAFETDAGQKMEVLRALLQHVLAEIGDPEGADTSEHPTRDDAKLASPGMGWPDDISIDGDSPRTPRSDPDGYALLNPFVPGSERWQRSIRADALLKFAAEAQDDTASPPPSSRSAPLQAAGTAGSLPQQPFSSPGEAVDTRYQQTMSAASGTFLDNSPLPVHGAEDAITTAPGEEQLDGSPAHVAKSAALRQVTGLCFVSLGMVQCRLKTWGPRAGLGLKTRGRLEDMEAVSGPGLEDAGAVSGPRLEDMGAVSGPGLEDSGAVTQKLAEEVMPDVLQAGAVDQGPRSEDEQLSDRRLFMESRVSNEVEDGDPWRPQTVGTEEEGVATAPCSIEAMQADDWEHAQELAGEPQVFEAMETEEVGTETERRRSSIFGLLGAGYEQVMSVFSGSSPTPEAARAEEEVYDAVRAEEEAEEAVYDAAQAEEVVYDAAQAEEEACEADAEEEFHEAVPVEGEMPNVAGREKEASANMVQPALQTTLEESNGRLHVDDAVIARQEQDSAPNEKTARDLLWSLEEPEVLAGSAPHNAARKRSSQDTPSENLGSASSAEGGRANDDRATACPTPGPEESSEEVQEYVAQLEGRLHSMRQSVGERPPEARGLAGLPAAAGAGLPRCAMEAIAVANMVHWKQSPALARQFVQELREELRLLQDTVEGNRAMREPLEAQMSQARREVAQMRAWTKAGDTEGQRHLQEEEARVERMQGEVRSFQAFETDAGQKMEVLRALLQHVLAEIGDPEGADTSEREELGAAAATEGSAPLVDPSGAQGLDGLRANPAASAVNSAAVEAQEKAVEEVKDLGTLPTQIPKLNLPVSPYPLLDMTQDVPDTQRSEVSVLSDGGGSTVRDAASPRGGSFSPGRGRRGAMSVGDADENERAVAAAAAMEGAVGPRAGCLVSGGTAHADALLEAHQALPSPDAAVPEESMATLRDPASPAADADNDGMVTARTTNDETPSLADMPAVALASEQAKDADVAKDPPRRGSSIFSLLGAGYEQVMSVFSGSSPTSEAARAEEEVYDAAQADEEVYKPAQAEEDVYETAQVEEEVYEAAQADKAVYEAARAEKVGYDAARAEEAVYEAAQAEETVYDAAQVEEEVYDTAQAEEEVYEAAHGDEEEEEEDPKRSEKETWEEEEVQPNLTPFATAQSVVSAGHTAAGSRGSIAVGSREEAGAIVEEIFALADNVLASRPMPPRRRLPTRPSRVQAAQEAECGEAEVGASDTGSVQAVQEAEVGAAPGSVQAVQEAQVGSPTPSSVQAVQEAQVGSPTPSRAQAVQEAEVGSAAPSSVQAVQEAQVGSPTPSSVQAVQEAQVGSPTPSRAQAVQEAEVGSATPSRMQAVQEAEIASPTPSRVQAVQEAEVGSPTTEEVQPHLTPFVTAQSVVSAGHTAVGSRGSIAVGSREEAGAIVEEIFALADNVLASRPMPPRRRLPTRPSRVQAVQEAEVGSPTPSSVQAVQEAEVGSPTPSRAQAVQEAEVGSAAPSSVQAVQEAQVGVQHPAGAQAVQEAEIASSTPSRAQAVQEAEVGSATPSRMQAVQEAEIASSTPSRVQAVQEAEVGSATPSRMQAVQEAEIASSTPSSVQAVQEAQVGSATPSRVQAVQEAEVGSPTPSSVQAVQEAEIASSTFVSSKFDAGIPECTNSASLKELRTDEAAPRVSRSSEEALQSAGPSERAWQSALSLTTPRRVVPGMGAEGELEEDMVSSASWKGATDEGRDTPQQPPSGRTKTYAADEMLRGSTEEATMRITTTEAPSENLGSASSAEGGRANDDRATACPTPGPEESSEEVQEYVAQLEGQLHSMRQSVGERPPEARGLAGLPAAAGAGLPRCAMEAIAVANMVHWKQSPALARQFVQELREELRLLQDTVEGNRAMREPLEAQMSQARREVAQMRAWTKAGDTEGQRHLQEEEARVERMQGEVRSFQAFETDAGQKMEVLRALLQHVLAEIGDPEGADTSEREELGAAAATEGSAPLVDPSGAQGLDGLRANPAASAVDSAAVEAQEKAVEEVKDLGTLPTQIPKLNLPVSPYPLLDMTQDVPDTQRSEVSVLSDGGGSTLLSAPAPAPEVISDTAGTASSINHSSVRLTSKSTGVGDTLDADAGDSSQRVWSGEEEAELQPMGELVELPRRPVISWSPEWKTRVAVDALSQRAGMLEDRLGAWHATKDGSRAMFELRREKIARLRREAAELQALVVASEEPGTVAVIERRLGLARQRLSELEAQASEYRVLEADAEGHLRELGAHLEETREGLALATTPLPAPAEETPMASSWVSMGGEERQPLRVRVEPTLLGSGEGSRERAPTVTFNPLPRTAAARSVVGVEAEELAQETRSDELRTPRRSDRGDSGGDSAELRIANAENEEGGVMDGIVKRLNEQLTQSMERAWSLGVTSNEVLASPRGPPPEEDPFMQDVVKAQLDLQDTQAELLQARLGRSASTASDDDTRGGGASQAGNPRSGDTIEEGELAPTGGAGAATRMRSYSVVTRLAERMEATRLHISNMEEALQRVNKADDAALERFGSLIAQLQQLLHDVTAIERELEGQPAARSGSAAASPEAMEATDVQLEVLHSRTLRARTLSRCLSSAFKQWADTEDPLQAPSEDQQRAEAQLTHLATRIDVAETEVVRRISFQMQRHSADKQHLQGGTEAEPPVAARRHMAPGAGEGLEVALPRALETTSPTLSTSPISTSPLPFTARREWQKLGSVMTMATHIHKRTMSQNTLEKELETEGLTPLNSTWVAQASGEDAEGDAERVAKADIGAVGVDMELDGIAAEAQEQVMKSAVFPQPSLMQAKVDELSRQMAETVQLTRSLNRASQLLVEEAQSAGEMGDVGAVEEIQRVQEELQNTHSKMKATETAVDLLVAYTPRHSAGSGSAGPTEGLLEQAAAEAPAQSGDEATTESLATTSVRLRSSLTRVRQEVAPVRHRPTGDGTESPSRRDVRKKVADLRWRLERMQEAKQRLQQVEEEAHAARTVVHARWQAGLSSDEAPHGLPKDLSAGRSPEPVANRGHHDGDSRAEGGAGGGKEGPSRRMSQGHQWGGAAARRARALGIPLLIMAARRRTPRAAAALVASCRRTFRSG
ncbi:hypothetical protein CYMTET_26222 [Cymbomonas tetramitiformis]|uniref:Uncharacterized protein n=1 Tax=Cymbomonas tetramitiformis TaxID=36881 RepID=A0AAE0FSI6_9CHLO|nr:hypothetical protein CYMTET_26222 [Cymbomonas tetramitiformis]